MSTRLLSRREREIMEILYAGDALSAADVRARMAPAPSYCAVRALRRLLEDRGQVRHEAQGPRCVYSPVVPLTRARRSAMRALVQTFFGGSPEQAVAALIDESKLGRAELDRLASLIEAARREGR